MIGLSLEPRNSDRAADLRSGRGQKDPRLRPGHAIGVAGPRTPRQAAADGRSFLDSWNSGMGYISTEIGRSSEPRIADRGAPCAVAERLRGRRRARGFALDRRSASLARGHRAGGSRGQAACWTPIYPELVGVPKAGGLVTDSGIVCTEKGYGTVIEEKVNTAMYTSLYL